MKTRGRVPIKLYLQKAAGGQALAGPPASGRHALTAGGFTAQRRVCAHRKRGRGMGSNAQGGAARGPSRRRGFCTEGQTEFSREGEAEAGAG